MARAPSPATLMMLGWEWSSLWFEANQVMWLRTMRLMQGGAAAQREAARMVAEKWQAAADLTIRQASGRGGQQPATVARGAVRHYRGRVAANRRRLGG